MPKISVIVPVYNVEKYIHRCIDSILAQTFTDFELILVDDGSTDGSGEICDEYAEKDCRIHVIHKENGGVSKARNTALDIAKGEFIYFVDSDDYIQNDCLETLYNAIIEDDFDCVSMGFTVVNDNRVVEKVFHFDKDTICIKNEEKRLNNILNYVLCYKTSWSLCSSIFSANIIKQNNIKVCETCEDFAEDLGFYLVYLMNCKHIRIIDYAGYFYVQRENSMMHKNNQIAKLNAMNEVSKYYYDYLKKHKNYVFLKHYYQIHFLIIYNQFQKLLCKKNDQLSIEFKKIKKKKWYNLMMIRVIANYKKIIPFICNQRAFKYKNMTFECENLLLYSIHNNHKLFCFTSVVHYKFLKK